MLAPASVMEKVTSSENNAGEIFSIDVVAVVLSRGAVDTLAKACSLHGISPSEQTSTATGEACTRYGVVPSVCGNLSRPFSLAGFPRAPSARGRRSPPSGCTESHEGATSTYEPPSATTREIPGATRSRSGLPSSRAAFPAVSEFSFPCKEATSRANFEHRDEIRTHAESHTSGDLPSSGGTFVEGTKHDIPVSVVAQEVYPGEHSGVFQPSADSLKRESRDRRRRDSSDFHACRERGNNEAGELVASSASVSSFRPGDPQRNNTDLNDILTECKENHLRGRSSRKNSAVGSIHTTGRSNHFHSAGTASKKDAVSYSAATHETNEGEDPEKQVCCVPCPVEQVHNFLAAALRAARSSLYVCLPIHATEALSFGCNYARPSTGSAAPEHANDGAAGAGDKEATGAEFPLQASGAYCVGHWDGARREHSDRATAEAAHTYSLASSQAGNRNKSSDAPPLRRVPSKIASTAVACDAASGTPAAAATPVSASPDVVAAATGTASAVSFPRASAAASPATQAAAVASVAVSGRATAPAAAPRWHDSRQGRMKGTSSTATPHADGFCCTYTQLDSHQPVITPTCCIFRIIYHLYTFLTGCAAAFAPFAADVYVVPVWVGARPRDAGGADSGSAASNLAEHEFGTGETATGEAAAAPPPAFGACETGSALVGEGGAAEGAVVKAASATALSGSPGRAVERASGEGDNFCEWQYRLLTALRSHCWSCRGLHVTAGKIVNVVDSTFEVADRSFAAFSSAAGELATYTYVLKMDMLTSCHFQPFSKVFSTLRIPKGPITIAARNSRGTTPGAETRSRQRDDAGTASPAGAGVYATEAATDPKDARHQQTGGAVAQAGEAKTSRTAAATPATAGATNAVAVEGADADAEEGAAAAEHVAAESVAAASEDTARDGTAAAEGRRLELADLPRGGAVCQFDHVIVAGTFDRLHAGHKLMLTVAALVSRDRLGIGTTAGALVQKKAGRDAEQAAAAVQTFAVRAHAAAAFVALIASAARATAPSATVSNRTESALATGSPSAASARNERAATPDDAAVAPAAEFGDIPSLATTLVPEETGTCTGDAAAETIGSGGRAKSPVPEDQCSSARAVRAAGTAFEAAAGRKEAFTAFKAPAGEDSGEVAALLRNTSLRLVHFVNYCQVVLHDEICKQTDTQSGSSGRCACVRRLDEDVHVQRHPGDVDTHDEGHARTSADGVAGRGAERRFSRAEAGKQGTARGLLGDTGCDEGDAEGNYAGSETEKEAKCQTLGHHRDEDGGIWTRDTTVATEVSNVADATVGVQAGTAREEYRAAREVSLRSSQKRSEQQGRAAKGDKGLPETEEQAEKGAVEVKAREKRWTKRVCEALAETDTIEGTSNALPDLNPTRLNNTSVTPTQENMCSIQSPEATWMRPGGEFLQVKCDRVFLPWTTSILPPNFFPDPNRLACKEMLADAVPNGIQAEGVANAACDDAYASRSTCAFSASALARPTLMSASAALSASAQGAVSSASSPAASSFPTLLAVSPSPGHETSVIRSSSPLPTFPVYTTTAGTSTAVGSPGVQCRTTGAPVRGTSAFSQLADLQSVARCRSACNRAPLIVRLMPIEDRLGPAADLAFDALIVSSESLAGGFYVNEERFKRFQSPVCLVEVPALSTSSHRVVPRAPAASLSDTCATLPLREHARSPAGESAPNFPAGGISPLPLGLPPAPAQSNATYSAEERPGAPGCGLDSSQGARHHATTHACAYAGSVRGQNSTSSSLVPEAPVNEQFAATVSRNLTDLGPIQETGVSKVDPVTPDLPHQVAVSWRATRLIAEECTLDISKKDQDDGSDASAPLTSETGARGANKSEHMKMQCIRAAADTVDKVSSSTLRQQQAAALQISVDIAGLRNGFTAATDLLIHAPAPVRRAYWSLLCSLYVAPWRRLFTLERLARLLSRIDKVKQRLGGLSRWGGTCDAVVLLSLYFAYAVHPPPGLYSRPVSPAHRAPARASLTLTPCGLCPKEPPAGSSSSWALQEDWDNQTLSRKPPSGSHAHETETGNIPLGGDTLASTAEHSVNDDALVANEQLMHKFIRDAAVCNRLRAYCLSGDFAKQPPASDASKKSSICEHVLSVLKGAPQMDVNPARLEDNLQKVKFPPCAGDVSFLRILVSCIRTARESCGFLLPCRSFPPVRLQETRSSACSCFRKEDSRLLHVQGKLPRPDASACSRNSCLLKHGGDLGRSEAEPPDGVVPILQQLESKCCRVVRLLEFLELALPEEIYDRCARSMREEYYHVCDCQYARLRNQQLKTLQQQLAEGAQDLTATERALIKQNLLRERHSLSIDTLQGVQEGPCFACACST